MKKSGTVFSGLMLFAGIRAFCAVTFLSYRALKDLSASYAKLGDADCSEEFSVSLNYDDSLYACLGFGIRSDPADPVPKQALFDFACSSVTMIDRRIITAGILYAMMLCTVFQYPLYRRFCEKRKTHLIAAGMLTPVLFLAFLGMIVILCALCKVPFILPGTPQWIPSAGGLLPFFQYAVFPVLRSSVLILVGLLCASAGSVFLAVCLRRFRFTKLTAAAAVPLVFIFFIFSLTFEGGILSDPEVDSFGYVYELRSEILDPNYEGEAYYDRDRNAFVVDGIVYEPQSVPNPDHLTGGSAAGAVLYELVDPYAGSSLEYAGQILEKDLSPRIAAAYALKAVLVLLLSSRIGDRKKVSLPREADR